MKEREREERREKKNRRAFLRRFHFFSFVRALAGPLASRSPHRLFFLSDRPSPPPRRGLGTFTVPPRLGRRTRAASRSPSPSQGAAAAAAADEEPAAAAVGADAGDEIFADAAAGDDTAANENNHSSQQPPAARRRRTSGGSTQPMQPDDEPLDDGAAEPMEGKIWNSCFSVFLMATATRRKNRFSLLLLLVSKRSAAFASVLNRRMEQGCFDFRSRAWNERKEGKNRLEEKLCSKRKSIVFFVPRWVIASPATPFPPPSPTYCLPPPPPPFCRNHLHAGVSTDPSSAQGPALTEEPAMTGVFQVRDREERTREERRRREREREKDREEEENRSRVVVVVVVDLSSQNLSLQKHTHTSSVRHPRRPQPGPRRQALLRHLPGRRPPLERPLLPEGQQGRPDLPLRQRRRRRGLGRRGRGLLADERPRRRRRAPRPSFGRLGPAPRLVQALAPPPLGRRGPRRQQGRHPHLRAPLRRLGLHQLCAAGRRARGVCAPGRLGRRAVRAVDGPERGAPGAAAESDARGAALRLPQGDGAR